jgi:hypothetical protein
MLHRVCGQTVAGCSMNGIAFNRTTKQSANSGVDREN